MHLIKKKQTFFWVIAILSMLTFISMLNLVDSGSYYLTKSSQKINNSIKDKDKSIVFIQLRDFDAEAQSVKARLWFYPSEKYATRLESSVILDKPATLFIDAAKVEYQGTDGATDIEYFESGSFLRAFDVELDVTNGKFESRTNDSWFPFDRYSVEMSAELKFLVKGDETDSTKDDIWEKAAMVVEPYTASLSGWSAKFDYIKFDGESRISTVKKSGMFWVDVELERTLLYKILSIFLGLIFVGGGISMLFLFFSILMSHRPPTLSGLAWAGSTAFTMIQTRSVIPGSPRIGIKFDLIIFYPALLLCFISGGAMFYFWITKDNWSREL